MIKINKSKNSSWEMRDKKCVEKAYLHFLKICVIFKWRKIW